MARIAGRNGRLYVASAALGAAEPVAFMSKWSINFAADKIEVTAFGDANKTYVAGLSDASGDFSGFYDDASDQMYEAARDGVNRKFYIYPNTSTMTQYFYGWGFFDVSYEGDVGGAVTVSGNWSASTDVLKHG